MRPQPPTDTPPRAPRSVGTRLRRRIALAAAAMVGAATLTAFVATPASACCVVPDHAIIVCQSASFYANYDSATRQPVGFKRTLYYGNKVGHTRGKHPVYNGWAATFDFGPNDWGYVRYECLGGWGSW